MPTEVHPIPRAKMLAQFQHTIAYRIAIPTITRFQTFETNANLGLRLLVSKRSQPTGHRLCAFFGLVTKDFNHGSDAA